MYSLQQSGRSTSSASLQPPPPQPSHTPLQTPSNQEIEAVIQAATASRANGPIPNRDTRTQLFVGNLPYRVRWQDLKDLFRKAGTVLRADVSLGPDNRSRGYGTVLLATAEDAGRAIDMFNGYSWQTRTLEVRPDRLPPEYDLNHPLASPFNPSPYGATSITPIPQSLSSPGFPLSASIDGLASGLIGNLSTSASASSVTAALNSLIGQPTSPTRVASFNAVSQSLSISRSASRASVHTSTPQHATGRSLFVGNLPFQCQWQDLKDLFRQIGPVVRADVALGPDGRSRGFGTVLFQNEADADKAVLTLNGIEYHGRVLKVHHDRFTQNGSPPATSIPPPIQPQQHASFIGAAAHQHSSLLPSHLHRQTTTSMFHSQPASPFDGFPPALAPNAYEQYLELVGSSRAEPSESGFGDFDIKPSLGIRPATTHEVPTLGSFKGPESDTSGLSSSSISQSSSSERSKTDFPSLHTSSSAPKKLPPPLATAAPVTPDPNRTTSNSSKQTSPNHPGTIPIPPPSGFPVPGMFSPPAQGLPPMTPSMPGFQFHPQVSTPPALHPHYLSPGIGPASPAYYRNGSFHAAPGAPPMTMMGSFMAMQTPPALGTPGGHPHAILTPGPPLTGGYHPTYVHPLSPGHMPPSVAQPEALATPYAANGQEPQGYFPPVQAEPEGYFPPLPPKASLDGSDGSSGPQSEAETATSSNPADFQSSSSSVQDGGDSDGTQKQTPNDPSASLRRLNLTEVSVPDMVNEIAMASGLGMGTAKKLWQAGGPQGMWMSSKDRLSRPTALSPPTEEPRPQSAGQGATAHSEPQLRASDQRPKPTKERSAPVGLGPFDKNDTTFDVNNYGLFGLPSPGGRRASWAEPGRRPSAVVQGESDSR